jgi:hypothetical protein
MTAERFVYLRGLSFCQPFWHLARGATVEARQKTDFQHHHNTRTP